MKLQERDIDAFFECPFNAYANNSHYVSPFKSDLKRFLGPENPLFRDSGDYTFFTVSEGGRALGRIVAHIHRQSNRLHHTTRSYFGFFDCINDASAASMLLEAAETWGRQQGCTEIAGNFNLTAMQQMGVMTDGFDNEPYIDQLYNPPHIPALLESAGYTPYFPMTTFEVPLDSSTPGRVLGEKTSLPQHPSLEMKAVTRRGFGRLMADACRVLNEGFAENPLFVPLTLEEYQFQAGEMMWVMDPHLSLIAYDGDKPVGAVICIPDLNPLLRRVRSRLSVLFPWHYLRHRFNRSRAVIIYYSVVPGEHGKGINSLMLHELTRRLVKRNYRSLGVTWIADVNEASLRQMEKMGARPLHRLHLFRKPLDDE